MNGVIKFQDNEYVWEEIEGKGSCLVPAPKPKVKVTAGDVRNCRAFTNGSGKRIQIISVYAPGGVYDYSSFFTVLMPRGRCGYSSSSFVDPQAMAAEINNADYSSALNFKEWCNE